MNLVFAGTPSFAVPALQALLDAGHTIRAVYTQPDRPAGRGRKLSPSPVKQCALDHGLQVLQPTTLRGGEEALAAFKPEVMIVAAYGLILPRTVLAVPTLGCINIHASLLPRWRGAAPIARSIEAGDCETGITIMQMEAGLDTGPMLLMEPTPILETDTAASLEEKLAPLGGSLLVTALEKLQQGSLSVTPQNDDDACYAAKLQKSEAVIDWALPANQLHRKIRALNPWPVASTLFKGEVLRIWNIGPIKEDAGVSPGTVVQADSAGIHIQTGKGVLALTQLQAAGGRALAARDFLNGVRVQPGDRLGA